MLEHPAEIPEQFDDPAQERETASIGMWVFLTTEVLFFGVLFTSYTISRLRFPEAFAVASRHNDLIAGAVETAVLLTSTLTMALAVRAVGRDEARRCLYFLLATIALGVLFCGIHGWEYYKHYEEHLIPGLGFAYAGPYPEQVQLFYFLYYVMTGLHLIHVVLGVAALGVIAVLTRRGKFSARYHIPVEMTGLYWHFVDVVWVFLFPLYYLVGRP